MIHHANGLRKMNTLIPDSEDLDYNPLSSVLHRNIKAPGDTTLIVPLCLSYAEK